MGCFRDCKGSLWELTIDIPTVRRVRTLTGIDLLNVAIASKRDGVFAALQDPITFADVIYAICKPEATERGLSDEQFAKLLDVDPNELANVLMAEIADFFRRRNQTKAADLISLMARKSKEAQAKMQAALGEDWIATVEKAFDAEMERQVQMISGSLSSLAGASSESTHSPQEV